MLLPDRKGNDECNPLAQTIIDFDLSSVEGNDLVDDR
jgi:hypothetical protein